MKILIVTQYFWPENFRINDLACDLQEAGVDVSVLTGQPNYPRGEYFKGYYGFSIKKEIFKKITVWRVPLVARGNSSSMRLFFNYLSFVVSGILIAPSLLHNTKFDLIFVYAPSPIFQALPAIFFAKLRRVPVVLWVQDLWPDSLVASGRLSNKYAIKIITKIVSFIYRRADLLLIQSKAFHENIDKFIKDSNKIAYFPNAAEKMICDGNMIIDQALLMRIRDTFSIVFAGNLGFAQSLETILSSAERLKHIPEMRFFLIGDGSLKKWLSEQIHSRKLNNIEVVGLISQGSMQKIFSVSSALLVSLANSPTLSLTIPSKLQSYFFAGKPVIGCLNGEGARIINEANAGITCPAGSVDGLVGAILALYALKTDERLQLGENAKKYYNQEFDAGKRLKELLVHFKNLVRQ